ncbi:MAG: methyltransferase domain-containing protein [Candidatus Lokiarchaeota archaeon]|nr:methyltransferase domain-containing protein [Candidatus Lokiarchaeota archaeon]
MIKWNKFAEDYDRKRRKPWNEFISFFHSIKREDCKFKGLNLDLGCANGRHFEVLSNENSRIIGIDNSIEFLKIAKKRLSYNQKDISNLHHVDLILADISNLPIRRNSIDNIFSIAALHHIKSSKERETTFDSLYTILKPDGYLLITVWRRWQKRFRKYFIKDWFKRIFLNSHKKNEKEKGLQEFGDIFVPWTISSQDTTINRFYHLYSSREFQKLLEDFKIKKFEKRGGPGGKDNFFVLAKKE